MFWIVKPPTLSYKIVTFFVLENIVREHKHSSYHPTLQACIHFEQWSKVSGTKTSQTPNQTVTSEIL